MPAEAIPFSDPHPRHERLDLRQGDSEPDGTSAVPSTSIHLVFPAAPPTTASEPRTTEGGLRKARTAAFLTAAVEPLLLTADEASCLYGVSSATWYRWSAAGRVPAPVRIGATVRWRLSELESHLEAGAPDRKTWEARQAAGNAGRARQAGR